MYGKLLSRVNIRVLIVTDNKQTTIERANNVESVEDLVKRSQKALEYIPKDQLILAPDCGMLELSRTVSKQKLRNLVLAAQKLNQNN